MTPEEFNSEIGQLAERHHLAAFHWPDSRRVTANGWPDWTLLGPGGILFREAKTGTARPTAEQTQVGYALKAIGRSWRIWRPSDLESGLIEQEMTTIATRGERLV